MTPTELSSSIAAAAPRLVTVRDPMRRYLLDHPAAEGLGVFREQCRTPLHAAIEVRLPGIDAAETLEGHVGAHGFFLETPRPAGVGTFVRFRIASRGVVVSGLGEVVWIRVHRDGAARPPGMGVEVGYLAPAAERALETLLAGARPN